MGSPSESWASKVPPSASGGHSQLGLPAARDGRRAAGIFPIGQVPLPSGEGEGGGEAFGQTAGLASSIFSMESDTAKMAPSRFRCTSSGRFGRCRRCDGCLALARLKLVKALASECALAPRVWVVTLTYREAPERLPPYREIQLWLKLVRKANSALRFFVCLEHGSKTGRSHWHVLLFCQKDVTRRSIEKPWPHGFVHSRLLRASSPSSAPAASTRSRLIRYLTKYVTKGSSFHKGSALLGFPEAMIAAHPAVASILSKCPQGTRVSSIKPAGWTFPDPYRKRVAAKPKLLPPLSDEERANIWQEVGSGRPPSVLQQVAKQLEFPEVSSWPLPPKGTNPFGGTLDYLNSALDISD